MWVKQFEDLKFWQKGQQISVKLYRYLWNVNDFGYKNQIQRAGISISNNIAEGFERQTNKELRQFLYIAKWSCGEVRSMLYIGKELWYFNAEQFSELFDLSVEVSRMIKWFLDTLLFEE